MSVVFTSQYQARLAGQKRHGLGASCVCVSGREMAEGMSYCRNQKVQAICQRDYGVWALAGRPIQCVCLSVQEETGDKKIQGLVTE